MPNDTWTALTCQHGKRCVVSISADQETIDAETERQAGVIFPLIRAHMRGDEQTAIDYGCGYGRFTGYLAGMVSGHVMGFDPCEDLVTEHQLRDPRVILAHGAPERLFASRSPFDLVFTAMVLCLPGVDVDATVAGLVGILAPGGLMVVIDHMPDTPPPGRWINMRPRSFYTDLFARHGVTLREVGQVMQLDNEVVILAGRSSG